MKTMGFRIFRTPVCAKNGLVERSTHVNQMLDDPPYFPKGHFSLLLTKQIYVIYRAGGPYGKKLYPRS